jgi:hypothetical protein
MGPLKLELRDLEILRALLRVRYLTSRQINNAFFSAPRAGRRRIQRLSELDLIRPHAKGMAEVLRYTAWRLTSRGLDAVSHAFPDEPVPDGLVDRVSTGSLHNALHREALADLYLQLTVPPLPKGSDDELGAHRRWVAEMRARASSITWQPDGDVVLSVDGHGQPTQVVPDAVVRSRGRRVFVEMDRSTKDLGRIRDCLTRYATVLHQADLAGDSVSVLFVVRSVARRENIKQLVDILPVVAHCQDEAAAWLRREFFSLTPDAGAPTNELTVEAAARQAYSYMRNLHLVLIKNGMKASLDQADAALMKDGEERLMALYRSLKAIQR